MFYPKKYNNYYKPYTRKNSSAGKITMSRNFKASAQNMTQNGLFNISVRNADPLTIPSNETSNWKKLDVPALISSSAMHRQLSNVFDQYRIEKVTIRIKPLANTKVGAASTVQPFMNCFSVVDRSGLSDGLTLADLRTYASYKETVWSMNGDTPVPHNIYIGQADLVSRVEYFDSKKTAGFPTVAYGLDLGLGGTDPTTVNFSVEIDAAVRYRGVRLDTSNVPAYNSIRLVNLRNGFTDRYPYGEPIQLTYNETQISSAAPAQGKYKFIIVLNALELQPNGTKYIQLQVNTVDRSINLPAESYYYVSDDLDFAVAEVLAVGFYDELYKTVPFLVRDWTANEYSSVVEFPIDMVTLEDIVPKFYEDNNIPVDP